MFFIRAVFWIALIVAFIPVNPSDLREDQRSVSTAETVGLAQSVFSDIRNFCERNANACETGGELISQMGIKAKEGARIAYQWLDQNYGAKPAGEVIDPVATSSIATK